MKTPHTLVIGAGMAGASLAAALAPFVQVTVVEQEERAGHHATGRSAALFTQLYGNAVIRALTRASRAFLEAPPAGFASVDLLTPRGCLYIAEQGDELPLERIASAAREADVRLADVSGRELAALIPALSDAVKRGLFEPDARDIDVDALHQGYLRAARAAGARLLLDDGVARLERAGSGWIAHTRSGARHEADVIVNAAGAWADEVAAMAGASPRQLRALRRTAALIDLPDGLDARSWPAAIDARERFYFKPEAGLLLVSPADETPQTPGDAAPEEIDVAIALDRLEKATTLRPRRVKKSWAGLRTFASDRTPIVGFDPAVDGFFWLAGQGGYGIQTAPALSAGAAALLIGRAPPLPEIRWDDLSPARKLPAWPADIAE